MTYIPIKTTLPTASALAGANTIIVTQGGVDKRTTLAALQTFVTGTTTPTPTPTPSPTPTPTPTPGPTPTSAQESAEGTSVTTVGPQILDAALNVYSISAGGFVVTNGTPETTISANVVRLYYHAPTAGAARQLYQQNSGGSWYTRTGPGTTYVDASDPTVAVTGGGAGPGPAVSGSFINVDCSAATGATLRPTLFGSSMASDVDFTPYGDASIQNAAKVTAGFGLPGMYARINTNDTSMDGSGNPNLTYVDRVSAAMPHIIDVTTGEFSYNLGGGGLTDPTAAANGAKAIANRFIANGVPCKSYELFNENNGLAIGTYSSIFNAVAHGLHSIDSTIRLIGTNDSYMDGGRMQGLISGSGSRVARLHYHSYSVDSSFTDSAAFNQALTRFGGDASGLRSAVGGTVPAGVGEYNMGGNPPGDVRQESIQGAVFNCLGLWAAFTSDPLTTHGAIWDWLGDGYYALIIDPNNNPLGRTPLTVVPVGYALKMLRQYMDGAVVNVTGPNGNLKLLSTVKGTRSSLWAINYDTATNFTGRIALSKWPVNATGNGTAQMLQVSQTDAVTKQTSVTVTGGLTASVTLPAMSVTVLTSS